MKFRLLLSVLAVALIGGCSAATISTRVASTPKVGHSKTVVFVAPYAADSTNAGTEAVTAFLAGIERAAEDAAQERAGAVPVVSAPQNVGSTPSAAPAARSWDSFAACVIAHESGGNPRAANPNSSASGLFQDLDSTWGGYGGYSRAMYAPVEVQYAMNFELWTRAGSSPWAGSGC